MVGSVPFLSSMGLALGGGLTPDFPFVGAALDIDFVNNIGFSGAPASPASLITTTRASQAYADDQDGNWISFGNNVSRITNKGLLVEEARTNSVRNNSMQGAVAGSPGTQPTNWALLTIPGVTRTISLSTVNGVDCIDVNYSGVNSGGTIQLIQYFDQFGQGAAASGQTWASSVFLQVLQSDPGISSLNLNVQGNNGSTSTENLTAAILLLSQFAIMSRASGIVTLANGGTTFARMSLVGPNIVNGQSINFTLRIGWPQLELGAFVTSPIRTTNAAVARVADSILLNSPPDMSGALSVLVEQIAAINGALDSCSITTNDGTLNNRVTMYVQGSSGRGTGFISSGNVSQFAGGVVGPVFTSGQLAKIALGYALNDGQLAVNGSLGGVDNALALPIGMNAVRIGGISTINSVLNSYLCRMAFWTSRLPGATLQALTN